MKVHKPVRWKEGMFLRPQHFQQHDRYLESREARRLQAVEQYHWGLLHCEIDENSLNNYVFNVASMSAVLPDGSVIDYPENAALEGRPFDAMLREIGQPLDVVVGIREREDRSAQTLENGGAEAHARFKSSMEEAYDLEIGRDPVQVERLVYKLRLFLGDEPTDGFETLPLARLMLTGDTGHPVRADPTFSPPVLVLGASPSLHAAARAVVERLSLVLRDLGQQRGGNDPDPLILYYGMSGSLPVLKDMVQQGQVHPRRVYQELARLAGALLYRDKEGRSSEEIPAYDHRQPGPVFDRLRQLIIELSEIVIQQPYRRCTMERDGERFKVTLPAEAKQAGARFFLEVSAVEAAPQLGTLILGAKASNLSRDSQPSCRPGRPQPISG
jgi:type VI secretion system protein ImpJ